MSGDMNNWNPMEEDFFNVRFNSYDTGPGAKLPSHLQAANYMDTQKKRIGGVPVYVYPIPIKFTKESLKNIFSTFGDVLDAWINVEKKYGFVFMKDLIGAHSAIRELNDKNEHQFKVSFAAEKSKQSANDANTENGYSNKFVSSNMNSSSESYSYYTGESMANKQSDEYKMNEQEQYDDDNNDNGEEGNWRVRKFFENCQQYNTALIADESRHTVGMIRSTELVPRVPQHQMMPWASPYPPPMQSTHQPPRQGIRECLCCRVLTEHRCLQCHQPFCSIDCNIRGYTHHTQDCIRSSGHSLDMNQNPNPHNPYVCKMGGMMNSSMPSNITSTNVNVNGAYANRNIQFGPYSDETDFKEDVEDYRNSKSIIKARNQSSKMTSSNNQTGATSREALMCQTQTMNSISRPAYRNSTERKDEMYRIHSEREVNNERQPSRSYNGDAYSPMGVEGNLQGRDGRHPRQLNDLDKRNDDGFNVGEHMIKNRYQSNEYDNSTRPCPMVRQSNDEVGGSDVNGSRYGRGKSEFGDEYIGFEDKKANCGRTNKLYKYGRESGPLASSVEIPSYLAREKRVKFVSGKPAEVRINSVNPLSVMFVEEYDLFQKMMIELQGMEHTERITNPLEQVKCVAPRKNRWYRAVIATVEPLTIRFMDMGVETYSATLEDLRRLPSKFKDVSKFCHRVIVANATSEELKNLKSSKKNVTVIPFGDVPSVSPPSCTKVMLQKESSVKNGDVSERSRETSFERDTKSSSVNSDNNSVTSSTSTDITTPLPDLSVELKAGIPITVLVTCLVDDQTFYVTDFQKIKIFEDIFSKTNPESFRVLKNIYRDCKCAAKYGNDGCWYRAKVVSVDPTKITYIDYGNSTSIDNAGSLKMLPRRFCDVSPMAVLVKLREGTVTSRNVVDNEKVVIVPIEKSSLQSRPWIVEIPNVEEETSRVTRTESTCATETISTSGTTIQRTLSSETFIDNTKNLNLNASENTSKREIRKVLFVYKESSRRFYVIDTNNRSLLDRMTDIPTSEYTKSPVKKATIGQKCVCTYDDIWSRAMIVSVSPLKVSFIDYGNIEERNLADLYHAPSEISDIDPLKSGEDVWEMVNEEPIEETNYTSTMQSLNVNELENHTVRVRVMHEIERRLEYGVLPTQNLKTFYHVQMTLRERVSTLSKLTETNIGDLCVVVNDTNAGFRGVISNTKPLTVKFIDLGYEQETNSMNLRKIPAALVKISPLAFQIALEDDATTLNEKEICFVELFDKLDEAFYVARICTSDECTTSVDDPALNRNSSHSPIPLFGDNEPSYAASILDRMAENGLIRKCPSMPSIDSIMDRQLSSSNGMIYFMKRLSGTLYTGMLLPHNHPFQQATDMMNRLESNESYVPKIDEIVGVFVEDLNYWVRGLVIDVPNQLKSAYLVTLLDFALIDEFDRIVELPDEFKKFPSHSIYIDLKTIPEYSLESKPYKFKIRSTNSVVMADLLVDSKTITAELRSWKPTIDSLPPRSQTFTNGCTVKISSLVASNRCAIFLGDIDSSDRRAEFSDALMLYCTKNTTEPLPSELLIREIYAVKYNSCYYRAEIREKKENQWYAVWLLDRGDEIIVDKDKIKSLPEKFKRPYSLTTIVTLKGVRQTEINGKERMYMDFLIMEEKEFELVIEGPSEVALKFLPSVDYSEERSEHETLNSYLNYLLIPQWKQRKDVYEKWCVNQDSYDQDRLTVSDLSFDEYEAGSLLSLYVVNAANNNSLIVVNKRGDSYRRIKEINLSGRLEEYATEITNPYVPIKNELCIVKHDDQWHRALCLVAPPSSKILVNLIDLGKIVMVWNVDIRIMPKEFLTYRCLGLICTVEGCNLSDSTLKELEDTEVSGCRILRRIAPGSYSLEIDSLK